MAISNVALFGGAFLTPVLVGKITASLGWAWTFYFVAIFAGLCLPLLYFFVPEMAFRRATHLNTDFEGDAERRQAPIDATGSEAGLNSAPFPGDSGTSERTQADGTSDTGHEKEPTERTTEQLVIPKMTFRESLRLFNGRKTDENFFKLLLRPLPLFFHPGILWVSNPYTKTQQPPLTRAPRVASSKALSSAGPSSSASSSPLSSSVHPYGSPKLQPATSTPAPSSALCSASSSRVCLPTGLPNL